MDNAVEQCLDLRHAFAIGRCAALHELHIDPDATLYDDPLDSPCDECFNRAIAVYPSPYRPPTIPVAARGEEWKAAVAEHIKPWGASSECRYIQDEPGRQTPVIEVRQRDFLLGRQAHEIVAGLTALALKYPGGLMLWAQPKSEHDAPVASIQALDRDNPTKTLWVYEAETLRDAMATAVEKESPSLIQLPHERKAHD